MAMEKNYLYQIDIRNWIEKSWGSEIMIPVYGVIKKKKMDVFIQSYFIPVDNAEEQLDTDTYDVHSLLPGFTVYGAWEDSDVVYRRYNSDIEVEPIVIIRNYNGLADNTVEIVEEFRLLFNLYYRQQADEYVDLSEDLIVVKIETNGTVYVHKKYLKSYLAVKKMALILHLDSRCIFSEYDENHPVDSMSYRNEDNTLMYTLNIGKCNTGCRNENFSIIFGKKIIYGCELKSCGIWPYDEEKKYVDFVIGVGDDGKEIKFTSDPRRLSNNFGANPEAPHYLTPVFFDVAVLNKYYSRPEIYDVDDCIIRCGNLWSLYIDNQKSGYVSAYLGDLGRDLPSEREQYYWRSYNKLIEGSISETKYKRDFLAQFTNPESIDFIFKNTYVRVNRAFEEKLGWNLFLELDEQDLYNFEGLRIPITNSIVEMDMLVLSLVKVLLDSLNEKNISKQLTGTYEKMVGSISKLEAWFQEYQLSDFQQQIKFLRNLQELRSSGTGHRKGKGYQKISKVFDVQKGNYLDAFVNILEQAIAFLEYVEENIDTLVTTQNKK